MNSEFVACFGGPLRKLDLGTATRATAEFEHAVVHGRPFGLSGGIVRLDPDGDRTQLEQALNSLDGRFSLVVCGDRRAVIATDILGCGGAYIAHEKGEVLVASHLGLLTKLLEHVEFDDTGAMAALAGSICIDGRSPFVGIRRLMAGEYALIDLDRQEIEAVASYSYLPETLGLGEQQPGDPEQLAALIRESVQREGSVDALFLTAGKDSRAIAGCLGDDPDHRPLAVTYGGWRGQDRRGSVEVANAFGLEHKLVGPLRLDPRRYVDEIVSVGGGLSGLQISQHLAGARRSRKRGIRSAFSGFLGDILTGQPDTADATAQSAQVVNRHIGWVYRNEEVPLDGPAGDALAEVKAMLLTRLKEYRSDAPAVAATLVDLTHRQSNFISGTFDHMHQHVQIATPFFYRPLISYLLSLPPDDLQQQRLYDSMLARTIRLPRSTDRGPAATLARLVESHRGGYGTVNWPKITKRLRPWLRRAVEPGRHTMVGELGLRSINTASPLPFAYFAVPLLNSARIG